MKTKKYKIWRFAYINYVDELILPSNMKLYQLPFDECNTYYAEEINRKVINLSYVGAIPYTDEAWKILNDEHQTLNIECYNIFNNDIVVHVNQICPLTDDFPVTNKYPHIGISYFEERKYADEDIKDIVEFHNKNKKKLNYDKLSKDFFCPVTKYIKIQGIDKKFPLMLDVYEVILTTKLDDIPFEGLMHTSKNINNVLVSKYDSRVKQEKISQVDYKFACSKQIELMA